MSVENNHTHPMYYGYDGEGFTLTTNDNNINCTEESCTERTLNTAFFVFIIFLWVLAIAICVYHVKRIDEEQERNRLERRERRRARREEKKRRLDPERRKNAIRETVTVKTILYTDGKGTIEFVTNNSPSIHNVNESKVASCCSATCKTSNVNVSNKLMDDNDILLQKQQPKSLRKLSDVSTTSSLNDDDEEDDKCPPTPLTTSTCTTTTSTTSCTAAPPTQLKSIRKLSELSDVSTSSSINDDELGKKCPPPPPPSSPPLVVKTGTSPSCLPSFIPPPPSSSSLYNDNNDDENGVMCSICLEPFESEEEVAWSKHMKCQHIFHADCLEQWLMKHDDCPICRKTFIEDVDLFQKELAHDVIPTTENGDRTTSATSGRNNNDLEEDLDDDDDTVDGEDVGFEDEGVVYYVVNGLVSYVRNTSYSLLSTPTTTTTTTTTSTSTVCSGDQDTTLVQNVPSTIDTGSSLEKIDEEEKEMEFCDNPQNLEYVCELQEDDNESDESSLHEKKLLKGKVKRRMNRQRYNSLASSDDILEEEGEEEGRNGSSDATTETAIGNIV